jgi:predicted SnoaL-like aldol condensation-catalyzing enzyme
MTNAQDQAAANRETVRRIFEVVLPDPDASAEFEDLVADDFVDHDAAVPNHAHGVDSLRATHADLHERWPGNVRFSIDGMIAEDDLVAMRWSAGPAEAMVWFRLRDGKLTDRWAMVRR